MAFEKLSEAPDDQLRGDIPIPGKPYMLPNALVSRESSYWVDQGYLPPTDFEGTPYAEGSTTMDLMAGHILHRLRLAVNARRMYEHPTGPNLVNAAGTQVVGGSTVALSALARGVKTRGALESLEKRQPKEQPKHTFDGTGPQISWLVRTGDEGLVVPGFAFDTEDPDTMWYEGEHIYVAATTPATVSPTFRLIHGEDFPAFNYTSLMPVLKHSELEPVPFPVPMA